jgi:8-oxo-dGTP pyrophosphatase MutT (NUDIX family)
MVERWRTVGSQPVLKDRWIDLRADTCVTPGGREISPYYVLSYPAWVHVVALTDNDELVLVRQYRHGAGEVMLELPAGIADAADADPEVTARRELAEETGYSAPRWRAISELYPNPAHQTNRVHVFLAEGAARTGQQALDPGEEGLEAVLMPLVDVLAGLGAGILPHSAHVAALLMALAAAGRLDLTLSR